MRAYENYNRPIWKSFHLGPILESMKNRTFKKWKNKIKQGGKMKKFFLSIVNFLAVVLVRLLILASGIWALNCFYIDKPQEGLVSLVVVLAALVAYTKIKFPR
jgi:hypothetical protein